MIGKVVFAQCSECDCGQERLIVNKNKFLCDEKNRLRLGPKKPARPIKHMTNKRNQVENTYRQAKIDKVDLEGAHCTGCGTTQRLSLSHLVPRSRRKDLIDEPKNHRIHCMSFDGIEGCHTKWEQKRFDELLDGQLCLDLVLQLDPEYYQLITTK